MVCAKVYVKITDRRIRGKFGGFKEEQYGLYMWKVNNRIDFHSMEIGKVDRTIMERICYGFLGYGKGE